MQSILSYFRSYFDPGGHAPLLNHSTGQIASHLHEILQARGPVHYFDNAERPTNLTADLFIGHFWAFAELCRLNTFHRKIAFYVVSDPHKTKALMCRLSRDYAVPEPLFDLPPQTFDHDATMELADLVLVVGNQYTLDTFPSHWHPRIRLINYSVDAGLYERQVPEPPRNEFCYVATYCGLRKGFMEVLQTWREISPATTRLHAVGHLDPPWDALLAKHNTGSIVAHGFVESHTLEYLRIIKSCKFAYIPTLSEGQMGSLLEVIHAGCVPITTRASGIDDEVLQHCIVVEPFDYPQHRDAIREALSWTNADYTERRARLLKATHSRHNWNVFRAGVEAAIEEVFSGGSSDPSRMTWTNPQPSRGRNPAPSPHRTFARADRKP